MRRKRKKEVSKWQDAGVLMTSTITGIDYLNKDLGGRYKNVFYVKSSQYPEKGRMCVLWGKYDLNIGDEITAKGRVNEQGIFLCWSLYITRKSA